MARIFVSYSRADSLFIDQFVPLLRRSFKGVHEVWYDDDIHGGANWWEMILSEINVSDLFIYLISNESLQSAYCQAEFREALRLQKVILPLLIRRADFNLAPDDIRPQLGSIQYIDISGRGIKDTEKVADLNGSITKLLKDM